ncbi:MAG: translation initiation factor IF-2 [Bacteroidia bacterium]|nr:translation initiation factor IF-2 [Bacteroidia bacterium]
MSDNKGQVYRLFQVAKELNVSTSQLVDFLKGKGHDVVSSPNTKLTGDQYHILVRQYASEKDMKAKADQMTEKRKEEVRLVNNNRPVSQPGTPTSEEEPDSVAISADDLRNNRIVRRPVTNKPPVGRVEPVSEKNDPPAPKEPPVADPASNMGIKILGRIDLSAFNTTNKKSQQKPATPPVKQVEEPAKPVVLPPPVVQQEAPLPEVSLPQPPVVPTPVAEVPVAPPVSPAPPPVVLKEEPAVPPVVVTPPPVAEVPPPAPEMPEVVAPPQERVPAPEPVIEPTVEDPSKVMRAEDNTPRLAGLKILDKINLEYERGKKRSGNNPNTPANRDAAANKSKEAPKTPAAPGVVPPATTSAEEEEKKRKRRRRKRKRKGEGEVKPGDPTAQKTTQGTAAAPKPGDKKTTAAPKKDKPTAKEVDNTIRNTMTQMGKGASRVRQRLRRAKRDSDAQRRDYMDQMMEEESRILEVTEFITANEFANLMSVPVNEIITKCFQLGMMVSINQRLDAEVMTLIAEEYDYEIRFVDVTEGEMEELEEEDKAEDLLTRNPIITVMGHVDHGKTTLLDYLRKANVAAGEAGGITQHIGAYEVKLRTGRMVTFLDTPGHEAFTAMRARGAKITDVAIIVIAADDAVMPQTREAINHAQAASVPMVFAINKIDKPGADPERIKAQLAEMNLLVEDWGGNYQCQAISALKGLNVDDLLEKVTIESDLLELKANPDRTASGTVIEARLDKGRGNVATVLVQNGTLSVGDEVVAGIHYGKVRALINQNGERVQQAGPAMPVQVLGISGQPNAGDKFYVFEEDGKAKSIAQKRTELYREQQMRRQSRLTLEEIGRRRALGNFKELNIIIRGDVDGSVEALSGSLLKLSTEEVQVNIIMKAVGAITEADVNLALASDAVIIAFNVRPNVQARNLADREEVDIRTYSVIYDAINEVRDALEGMLAPEVREEITGTLEVLEVFKITRVGNVAGGRVASGKVTRSDLARVIRDSVVIFDSKFASLRRFKDDVKEVLAGQDCGFMIENYPDLHPGDVVEAYRKSEVRRKLN